jgi:hypothetical protein
VDRPAKFPASKFPVWCFPAIALYQLHPSMQSMPLETVVLPSKAVMVVDGPCPHPDWCMYNANTGVKYYLYYTQQCGKDSRFALPAVEKTTFQGKLAEDAWRALEWTTVLRSATLFSSNTFALDEDLMWYSPCVRDLDSSHLGHLWHSNTPRHSGCF